MEETIRELIEFIRRNILDEQVELEADTILKNVGVDSFSIVEIVLFIERRYGKLIPDHLMVPETFTTVRNLANIVASLEQE